MVRTFSKRVLTLLCAALSVSYVVDATMSMGRPDNVNEAHASEHPASHYKTETIEKRSSGKVQMAYYPNWAIYSGLNFPPTKIDTTGLTHIIYAFADNDASSGTVTLTDSWADEQIHYPGDSWSDSGNNLYGCLKQMYLLKLAHRDLKVLLSVGGWTYTNVNGHFNNTANPSWRANFVSSAIQLIKNYGFDGIDLDYEYPGTPDQGQGFADLLTELRTALTQLQQSNGDSVPYQLTAAVPAGLNHTTYLNVPQMDRALDYYNLMAYDFAGSWLTWTDNQANIYGGQRTGVAADASINWYLSKGATASKINLGIPAYGRAFQGTTGLGAPYTTVGPGSIDVGIYAYHELPHAGATVYENTTDITSYSYDPAKQELVSYDTPNIARMKAQYAQKRGLAGAMFWDLATDATGSPSSLVRITGDVFGALDTTKNHINYPGSKWDNIRSNMGQGGSTPTGPSPPTSSTPAGGNTGTCAGVAAWSSSAIYTAGMKAAYNGHVWSAKWWTQGETPGSSSGVWQDNGSC